VIKLLWNSVLSTPGAEFASFDLKDFYLGTKLKRPEYMRLPLKVILKEIIDAYNLEALAVDGWVYCRIDGGMYGLPQAGKIAHDTLVNRLRTAGYYPVQFTAGLWRHVWRPITFALVVDDFGIKFKGKEHATHLLEMLKQWYKVTTDWEGSKYVGIDLQWDYDKRTLETSVPGYVKEALHQLQHKAPPKPVHSPAKAKPIQYGAKIQTTAEDTSEPLSEEGIKKIQSAVGKFIWYGAATDPTMAKTLSSIANKQAKATKDVEAECKHFGLLPHPPRCKGVLCCKRHDFSSTLRWLI